MTKSYITLCHNSENIIIVQSDDTAHDLPLTQLSKRYAMFQKR